MCASSVLNGYFQSTKEGLKRRNSRMLVDALGVSSEGSVADMINRLLELLKFKDIYPKLFVKLQKASGEKKLGI